MFWSRGPIKVDRKRGQVKILGKSFPYWLQWDGVLVNRYEAFRLVEGLAPRDIPKGLTVGGEERIRDPSGGRSMLVMYVDSGGLTFELGPSPGVRGILTAEEFRSLVESSFVEFGRQLQLTAYNVRFLVRGRVQLPPDDAVCDHTSLVRKAVRRALSLAWAANQGARMRSETVLNLARSLDGPVLASTLGLRGVLRWTVGALQFPEIASILLRYENPLVVRCAGAEIKQEKEVADLRMSALGITVPQDKGFTLTRFGKVVEALVVDCAWDIGRGSVRRVEPSQREAQLSSYFAYYVLRSVWDNFVSVAFQRSPRIRGQGKKMKPLLRSKVAVLTFPKLAIVTALKTGNIVPSHILESEIDELVREGFVSERLGLRSYGEWAASIAINCTVRLLGIAPRGRVRSLPPEAGYAWARSRPEVTEAWGWDVRAINRARFPVADARDVLAFAAGWERALTGKI